MWWNKRNSFATHSCTCIHTFSQPEVQINNNCEYELKNRKHCLQVLKILGKIPENIKLVGDFVQVLTLPIDKYTMELDEASSLRASAYWRVVASYIEDFQFQCRCSEKILLLLCHLDYYDQLSQYADNHLLKLQLNSDLFPDKSIYY